MYSVFFLEHLFRIYLILSTTSNVCFLAEGFPTKSIKITFIIIFTDQDTNIFFGYKGEKAQIQNQKRHSDTIFFLNQLLGGAEAKDGERTANNLPANHHPSPRWC